MLELRQLKTISLLILLAILLFPIGTKCSAEQPVASAEYLAIIVIDACRPDYFQLTDVPNLRLLMANGVTYAKAWLAQLESNTQPGHATVSTGSLPRSQGVIGFGWRDPVTGNMVRVLISNFDSYYEELTLALTNLPWQDRAVRCEVYLIDETNNLTLRQIRTNANGILNHLTQDRAFLHVSDLSRSERAVTEQTTTRTGYLGYGAPMILITLVVAMAFLIALVIVVERSKLSALLRKSYYCQISSSGNAFCTLM